MAQVGSNNLVDYIADESSAFLCNSLFLHKFQATCSSNNRDQVNFSNIDKMMLTSKTKKIIETEIGEKIQQSWFDSLTYILRDLAPFAFLMAFLISGAG